MSTPPLNQSRKGCFTSGLLRIGIFKAIYYDRYTTTKKISKLALVCPRRMWILVKGVQKVEGECINSYQRVGYTPLLQTSDCRCKIMNKFVCLCVLHLKPSSFSSFSITFLCIFLSNIALTVIWFILEKLELQRCYSRQMAIFLGYTLNLKWFVSLLWMFFYLIPEAYNTNSDVYGWQGNMIINLDGIFSKFLLPVEAPLFCKYDM